MRNCHKYERKDITDLRHAFGIRTVFLALLEEHGDGCITLDIGWHIAI